MTLTSPHDHPPLRLGLFKVKCSSNLGDGLLSECLEAELQRALPGATTLALDLAGRLDGEDHPAYRMVLGQGPVFTRQAIFEAGIDGSLKRCRRPTLEACVARDCETTVTPPSLCFHRSGRLSQLVSSANVA